MSRSILGSDGHVREECGVISWPGSHERQRMTAGGANRERNRLQGERCAASEGPSPDRNAIDQRYDCLVAVVLVARSRIEAKRVGSGREAAELLPYKPAHV